MAVATLLFAAAAGGCDRGDEVTGSSDVRPVVCTTFYPTEYFVESIAGGLVDVVCPLPDDADPATWKPDAEAVGVFQQADLVVVNGADFEGWLENVSLPMSRLVVSAEPFRDEWITIEDAVTHKHGPEGEHSHEGLDGHTWLDPRNALAQATAIHAALADRFAEHAEKFTAGLAALRADLEALDEELQAFAEKGVPKLLCSHPAYNYLARRYGWEIHNLHLEPDEQLDDEGINDLRSVLESFPARWILWESEPLAAVRARLKDDLGLESVVFSPCESLSSGERETTDYLAVMRANIERLRRVVEDER